MKHIVAAIALVSGLVVGTAHAQEFIAPTSIQQISNGWSGEQVGITVARGSSPCPFGTNEYAIDKNHAAYKELVSLALLAFATDAKILIRPNGTCLANQRAAILELRLVK